MFLYLARVKVQRIRMRHILGPEVVIALTKDVVIGGLDLTLTLYRCGDNYKIRGRRRVKEKLTGGLVVKQTRRLGIGS